MTLTQLFTAIANQIRRIKGTSQTIIAENFPTEMSSIELGHLDNTEYNEANDDLDDILEGSTPMTIYPPDWSEIGYEDTPQNVMDSFNYAKDIKDNWDSSITNYSSKYSSNTNIVYMPPVDTSHATNMNQMFAYATNLYEVGPLDTSNVTDMKQMFQNCSNLVKVPVFNASKNMLGLRYMFVGCPKLSNESLNNIMATCIGATIFSSTKTLANLGLTSAQATICQGLSNYQDFLAAGWTTGY